jgi:hypothetical protein
VRVIADTPGALDAACLSTLLHTDVAAVGVEPLGTGQMCDSYRLTLRYGSGAEGPATLVAKLPAADPTSRATGRALGIYEIEVRFYQELAPALPVRTPAVIHADLEDEGETTRFVLLLEDLAPAQPGDQLAGCTATEAAAALDELVRLHAPRWGDPSLDAIPWLHKAPGARQEMLAELLPQVWDAFRERYGTDLDADVHTAGDALFPRLGEHLGADTGPWTVVHGDYRLDNLLFPPARAAVGAEKPARAAVGAEKPARAAAPGARVGVVDWQMCAHGPALGDVAYFIGAGLHGGERRAVEEDLVRRYHDGLVAAGVTGFGWDRCWLEYRRSTWAGLIMAVAASMLVERTDRGDQMFLTMARRHARHALDLDGPDAIGS